MIFQTFNGEWIFNLSWFHILHSSAVEYRGVYKSFNWNASTRTFSCKSKSIKLTINIVQWKWNWNSCTPLPIQFKLCEFAKSQIWIERVSAQQFDTQTPAQYLLYLDEDFPKCTNNQTEKHNNYAGLNISILHLHYIPDMDIDVHDINNCKLQWTKIKLYTKWIHFRNCPLSRWIYVNSEQWT